MVGVSWVEEGRFDDVGLVVINVSWVEKDALD